MIMRSGMSPLTKYIHLQMAISEKNEITCWPFLNSIKQSCGRDDFIVCIHIYYTKQQCVEKIIIKLFNHGECFITSIIDDFDDDIKKTNLRARFQWLSKTPHCILFAANDLSPIRRAFITQSTFYLSCLVLFEYLPLANAANGDMVSYPIFETDKMACNRKDFLTRSCSKGTNVNGNIAKLCGFDVACGQDKLPHCVQVDNGSEHICVKKRLACQHGVKWNAQNLSNDQTTLIVTEDECQENFFQDVPSNCFDACLDQHASLTSLPKGFRVVSMGDLTSPTMVTCDFTAGFYNRYGKVVVDFDREIANHRMFYEYFCLNDPNHCKDGTCVSMCAEGFYVDENSNYKCQIGNWSENALVSVATNSTSIHTSSEDVVMNGSVGNRRGAADDDTKKTNLRARFQWLSKTPHCILFTENDLSFIRRAFITQSPFFLLCLVLFGCLPLANSANGDMVSYPILETDKMACNRKYFLTRSCSKETNVNGNIAVLCGFDVACGQDKQPHCVQVDNGSVYICVKKRLACQPGVKWNAHILSNDQTTLIVKEDECPENFFQDVPSNCFDACHDQHASLTRLPKGFRVVRMGDLKSPTMVTCDFTAGFYNPDGKVVVDFDREIDKHRMFYKFFCLNDPNHCKNDQQVLPNGTCVSRCAKGFNVDENSNYTCQIGNWSENALVSVPTYTTTKHTSSEDVVTNGSVVNRRGAAENNMNMGVVVGVSVGTVLFLAVIIIVFLLVCRIRNRGRKKTSRTRKSHADIEMMTTEKEPLQNETDEGMRNIRIKKVITGRDTFNVRKNKQVTFNVHVHSAPSTSSVDGLENNEGTSYQHPLEDNRSLTTTDSKVVDCIDNESETMRKATESLENESITKLCPYIASEETEMKQLYNDGRTTDRTSWLTTNTSCARNGNDIHQGNIRNEIICQPDDGYSSAKSTGNTLTKIGNTLSFSSLLDSPSEGEGKNSL